LPPLATAKAYALARNGQWRVRLVGFAQAIDRKGVSSPLSSSG
jgi:hypothetical protein